MIRHAFTLIELLVVIAIIAILAAILFPVFAQAREKARQASCMSNIKQLTLAVLSYNQDYNERFPCQKYEDIYDGTMWVDGNTALTNWNWAKSVLPYVKNSKIWVCPTGFGTNVNRFQKDYAISYNMNGYLVQGLTNLDTAGVAPTPLRLVEIGKSAETVMLYCSGTFTSNSPSLRPSWKSYPHACPSGGTQPAAAFNNAFWEVYGAHLGRKGTNTAWVDGHASFTNGAWLESEADNCNTHSHKNRQFDPSIN